MSGFELRISGVRSNRSTNWVTTTANCALVSESPDGAARIFSYLRPGFKPTTLELHRDLAPLKNALRTELLSRGIHWSDHYSGSDSPPENRSHRERRFSLTCQIFDFLSNSHFIDDWKIMSLAKLLIFSSHHPTLSLFVSATGLDLGQRSPFGLLFRSLGDILSINYKRNP